MKPLLVLGVLVTSALSYGQGLRSTKLAPDVVMLSPMGSQSRGTTEVLDPRVVGREAKALSHRIYGVGIKSAVDTEAARVSVAGNGVVTITHRTGEALYGMRGTSLRQQGDSRLAPAQGILRNAGATVAAGAQGNGGAPLVFTAQWGVFIDSVDGEFTVKDSQTLEFHPKVPVPSRTYLIYGPPKRTIEVVTILTGRPPMVPKWTLGFMNSQWGTTENEVNTIVSEYGRRKIPLDAFILDFDFKAWGEDNYGEWRWNSTSGPGAVSPNKFPNGASGRFAQGLLAQGVHLVGIMKPRILTENAAKQPTQAAKEASAHGWWMSKPPYKDYFSSRLANDLDFSKPALRSWFWAHSRQLFLTGIEGWWNDEADDGFDSLGFFHMQQSLFDGQTRESDKRVWSLNRNFYSGAQRFGFATWSGDIRSGFASMADQRARMLTIINLAQPHWSMDTGGFAGTPTPENYGRWMEFAAMVPIMRVHGSYNKHRQPWVYGDAAEAAATNAIRLRYSLLPYFYSNEVNASRTGVGIVRPLFWEFPDDSNSANIVDEWMVGDRLLVAPVVEAGQREKTIYLPPGKWFEWGSGREFDGATTVSHVCDNVGWSDLPLFVREGAIIGTVEGLQNTGQTSGKQMQLECYPSMDATSYGVYDDDGQTRACEHGKYFEQKISMLELENNVRINLGVAHKGFAPPSKTYSVRLHGFKGSRASWNGKRIVANTNGNFEIPAGEVGELLIQS